MTGPYVPPEPQWAHDDLPAHGPETGGVPGPLQPVAPSPRAALPGAGQATWPGPAADATPAGVGSGMAPAGVGTWPPPSPPGTPPDPAEVTGPPWPRLVAASTAYTPPKLIRWPIVVGIVLFAGWIATVVALRTAPISPPSSAAGSTPSSAAGSAPTPAAPYVLTARGAHFTATFPGKPHRIEKNLGTISVIAYTATLSDHVVGVTYFRLPASASFSLDRAITGMASSMSGATVVSRRPLTYRGQHAEDAVISVSGGSGRIRVVRFGSSAYVLEGFGNTAASFAHDYKILLRTFTPHQR
jgi:hypothetical protein